MKLLGRGFPRLKIIAYGRQGCEDAWILTPFGIPLGECYHRWIDEENWLDFWYWTD